MLRADEAPLSAEQRCAIEQNRGVVVEGTTGVDFITVEQAKAYFMAGMVPYIEFPISDVPDEYAQVIARRSWGRVKSIYR